MNDTLLAFYIFIVLTIETLRVDILLRRFVQVEIYSS